MTWKIEQWLTDVFPGQERIYSAYRHLSGRELVIVATAVLDSALAMLLERRFRDLPAEIETFLGANGDGRAPAATFGARIQLALLLGVLTEQDATLLRHLKKLRNVLSHRVNVDLCSDDVLKPLRAILNEWRGLAGDLHKGESVWPRGLETIEEYLGVEPDAAEGLVLAVLTAYQALFHRLSDRVARVQMVQ